MAHGWHVDGTRRLVLSHGGTEGCMIVAALRCDVRSPRGGALHGHGDAQPREGIADTARKPGPSQT